MNKIDYDKLWIEDYPELGTGTIPTEPCTSPEYYKLEQERVFPKVWLCVGRVEEVAKPGDYFVQDMAVCKTSIVIACAEDGGLIAFHNVCMHRGNKLVWDHEKRGNARSLTCRFHGWTFAMDGRLVGVPDEKMFYSLKKDDCGLARVSVDTWEGFIFINLLPKPTESLKEFLGSMGDHLAGFPYGSYTQCYSYGAELNANWKVCLDAFSEAYHVRTIHGQTVGRANFSKENPMSHPMSVGIFGKHRSCVVYGNPEHEPGPTAKIAGKYGLTSMIRGVSLDMLPPQLNPERRPEFNFDLNVLFPNFLIHVRPGEFFTHVFWPLGPEKTYWEGRNYFPPPKTPGQRFSQEYSHTMRRNAWLEDTSTMEATHAGLASGILKQFHLSDPEILVRHGYKVLEQYVGGLTVEAARD